MIRSEAEYQAALTRLKQDRSFASKQRTALVGAGLKPEQVERAMEPLISFHAQLSEEVDAYESDGDDRLITGVHLPDNHRTSLEAEAPIIPLDR